VAAAGEATGQAVQAAQAVKQQEQMELPVRVAVAAEVIKSPEVVADSRMDALAPARQDHQELAEQEVHVPIPVAVAAAVTMAAVAAAAIMTCAVMTAAVVVADQATPIRLLQQEQFIPGAIMPGMDK
jgi:hypothetical protein